MGLRMIGIDIFESSPVVAVGLAGFAGLLSFLSPCVLPIVPPYLAFMGGITVSDMEEHGDSDNRVLIAACCFVAGLSVVFMFLGLAASTAGRMLLQFQAELGVAAGVMILVFGIHFLGIVRIPLFDREARINTGGWGGSALGAFVLGLAFAFGWTPCIGPILGAILSLVIQEGSGSYGAALMAAYAVGLGVPFILVAAFVRKSLGIMQRFRRVSTWFERTAGCLFLLVGTLLVTGNFSDISFWLLETFPGLADFG